MYYTRSSGMPAREMNHRIVVVSSDEKKAITLLQSDMEKAGWLEDSQEWLWAGAGSQSFESKSEAIAFANYLMGNE